VDGKIGFPSKETKGIEFEEVMENEVLKVVINNA
jgi:hypothetical protein